MNKIIFLDFDGVLNTEHYQNYLMYQGKPWRDEYGALFDPKCVRWLKRIIDETEADIVIESSWKVLGLEAMQRMWTGRQLPGRVIDVTDSHVSDKWLLDADLDDIDPAMGHCKGAEIASWLSEHTDGNVRYVIIDDEAVWLKSQIPCFILTNPYDGITRDIADRAIALLNHDSQI